MSNPTSGLLKKLISEDSTYKLLYENLPDGICIIDVDGKYVEANPGIEKLTGYSADEFLKLSPDRLFCEQGQLKREQFFHRALEGETGSFEITFRRRDGSFREAHTTFVPIIHETGVAGVFSITRDITADKMLQAKGITERNRMEEALRESEGQYRLISEYSMDFPACRGRPLHLLICIAFLIYAARIRTRRNDRYERI